MDWEKRALLHRANGKGDPLRIWVRFCLLGHLTWQELVMGTKRQGMQEHVVLSDESNISLCLASQPALVSCHHWHLVIGPSSHKPLRPIASITFHGFPMLPMLPNTSQWFSITTHCQHPLASVAAVGTWTSITLPSFKAQSVCLPSNASPMHLIAGHQTNRSPLVHCKAAFKCWQCYLFFHFLALR